MTAATSHRLDGLEPDNLLAFMALLGLLRALEIARPDWHPRAYWDMETAPLRPFLRVAHSATEEDVTTAAIDGIDVLASVHDFAGQKDINYSRKQCRQLLEHAAESASTGNRYHVDLLGALMSDAAIKDDRNETVNPTPLCLLFGQGHQHFLERLAGVPRDQAPPPRGRGKKAVPISATECLAEALFHPWHRSDPTFSFRWDPEEDIRYALMAGDPTDSAHKPGTQHGANRLAAIGLGALALVPETRAGRIRPKLVGGQFDRHGFSFAWPIWSEPATFVAIRSLLSHQDLRTPGSLAHLGVDHVMVARRISVGKYMNFTHAQPLRPERRHAA